MSYRTLIFLLALVLVPNVFAQLQINAFVSVSSANPCSGPLDPNLPIDVGSAAVGVQAGGGGICIFNTGATAITITNVTVTGTDFSTANNSIPFTLQPNLGNFFSMGINFKPTAVGTRTGQLTVTDDAAGSPQTFQIVGTGFSDFGISLHDPGAGTQTTLAGGGPLYHLEILGAAGFSGTINISCSGLPTGAACKPPTSSFTLPGSSGSDFFLQITTTAPPIAQFFSPRHAWFTLAVVAGMVIAVQRRKRTLLFLIPVAVISCLLIACGGSSKSAPSGPTPPGTYTFSVTGTSNGVSHSRNLTLIVK